MTVRETDHDVAGIVGDAVRSIQHGTPRAQCPHPPNSQAALIWLNTWDTIAVTATQRLHGIRDELRPLTKAIPQVERCLTTSARLLRIVLSKTNKALSVRERREAEDTLRTIESILESGDLQIGARLHPPAGDA